MTLRRYGREGELGSRSATSVEWRRRSRRPGLPPVWWTSERLSRLLWSWHAASTSQIHPVSTYIYIHIINNNNLTYKRRYVCLSVCLSVCMWAMAGQTAGPIKTKLGMGTHVDPGSVLGKVKVIWRHLANANKTPYRGPQGPREFDREAVRDPCGPR